MRTALFAVGIAVLLAPAFAAHADTTMCPGEGRDFDCMNFYNECMMECEGKEGSYATCRDIICAERQDACTYGFVLSDETTYPITSKTAMGCVGVCTQWHCFCTPTTGTGMRRYDTYYNITQTKRRRCCDAVNGDWCPSGYEYDDIYIIPKHRECYKHDSECNFSWSEPQCNHDGCYINEDDTIRFTIYEQ